MQINEEILKRIKNETKHLTINDVKMGKSFYSHVEIATETESLVFSVSTKLYPEIHCHVIDFNLEEVLQFANDCKHLVHSVSFFHANEYLDFNSFVFNADLI